MISIASSNHQRLRTARPNTVLVLEPPRHTRWPFVFLGPGKHTIGTSPDSAIRIDAEGVQPRHALILVGDQKILLKALDPKTWVNDGAASETMLRPGDRISIGPITFLARPATARELEEYQQSEPMESEPESTVETREAVGITSEPVDAPIVPEPTVQESNPVFAAAELPSVPIIEEPIRPSPEAAFQEIHRHLESLNEPIVVPQIAPARTTMEDDSRERIRQDQLNQLASELARQSQRLREQTSRIAEREAELERKQSAIAEENERLIGAAQATRQDLAEEHTRQMALWQEWDSAYKRTSEELKQQLQAIEQRRTELQAENERLGADRLEIQRLKTESESERRQVAADRVQLTTEFGELHAQRSAFETERRQLLISIQEREVAVANERRALAAAHDDIFAARQQFEHERTLFATERSAESLRREQDVHEQTLARVRLTDQESDLQAKHLELEAAIRQHEEQRTQLQQERSLVEGERSEIHELRAQIHQLESELDFTRQSHHDLQATIDQLQLDSDRKNAEFAATLQQFEIDRVERQREQSDLDTERSEAHELHARLHQLESELNFSRQSQHELQIAFDQLQLETDRIKTEFNRKQEEFDALKVELHSTQTRLQQEQSALAAARAELVNTSQDRMSARTEIEDEPKFNQKPLSSAPAVERLMGIVPEQDDSSRRSLSDEDSLPSYFGHPSSGHFKDQPPTASGETFFSASAPTSELNVERTEAHDDLGYGLTQLSTQPMRSEQSEDGGPHGVFEPENEASLTTDEILASTLVDDPSDQLPDVDRTLTEVNEQFGYVSSLLNHYLSPLTPEFMGTGKSSDITQSLTSHPLTDDFKESSERPYHASDDSIPSLRAQLAEMFDLPENPRMAVDSMKRSGFGLDAPDLQHEMENRSLDERSAEPDTSGNRSEIAVGSLLSEFTKSEDDDLASSPQVELESSEQGVGGEDQWTRRVRELSQSSEPAPVPPEPEPEASVSDDDSTDDSEGEFSVEAQLARLLGRPYRPGSSAAEKPKPPVPTTERHTDSTPVSKPEVNESSSLQPVDRSHLNEAPKHKTDRTALRDEVQSFREVAQISARTALAKHSWNNLKNEFYFISALTAASSVATAWFLGTFVAGWETDPWKGVTCAVATILCSHRMVKSSAKLNQWHRTNRKNQKKDPEETNAPPEMTIPKSVNSK